MQATKSVLPVTAYKTPAGGPTFLFRQESRQRGDQGDYSRSRARRRSPWIPQALLLQVLPLPHLVVVAQLLRRKPILSCEKVYRHHRRCGREGVWGSVDGIAGARPTTHSPSRLLSLLSCSAQESNALFAFLVGNLIFADKGCSSAFSKQKKRNTRGCSSF